MVYTSVLNDLNHATTALGAVFRMCPRPLSALFVCGVAFNLAACSPDMGDTTSPPSTTTPTAEKWSSPIQLSAANSNDRQDSDEPRVAMDNDGNAIVVWTQHNPDPDINRHEIFKSEYRGGAWAKPTDLTTDNISPAGTAPGGHVNPQVAMNDSGQATIVWRGIGVNGFFRTFRSGYNMLAPGAWKYPANYADAVSGDTPDAEWRNAHAAMDNNGNAIIVWEQHDGANTQIYMSEYRGGSWTAPSTISPTGQDAETPQVAMDNNGNAIIVWAQHTTDTSGAVRREGRHEIFTSEYRNGIWTGPADLSAYISPDTADGGHMLPQVAMNDSGQAVIAWRGNDGNSVRTYRSDYNMSASGSWRPPMSSSDAISPDMAEADWRSVQVAMDDNGNAIIVWEQTNGANTQIFKSEYRNGSWDDPTNPNDNISVGGQDAALPQVAMGSNANAIIVWEQWSDPNAPCLTGSTCKQIFKSEYRNGRWAHPADLTSASYISLNRRDASKSQVAMDDNGHAVIVWQQFDGTTHCQGVTPSGACPQIFKSEYPATRSNSLDTRPPWLDSTSPNAEATNVSTALATITATFSESLAPNIGTISVSGGVTGTSSVSGKTITFTITSGALDSGRPYTAMATGVTDRRGNPAPDFNWSFSTSNSNYDLLGTLGSLYVGLN